METVVHYFSPTDTAFLFPQELRRKEYSEKVGDFENTSKWFNRIDEKKIVDDPMHEKCIRIIYDRSLHRTTFFIRIEESQVIIKMINTEQEACNTHYDTTLLAESERVWLKQHFYYRWLVQNHQKDSSGVIAQIVSTFPDIENKYKRIYLKEKKGTAPNVDSIIYTKKTKAINNDVIERLLSKLDTLQIWTLDHFYHESVMDGSGFVLEVKNGNKYNIVDCSNCRLESLIKIRDELLKFTNLKKDEIY